MVAWVGCGLGTVWSKMGKKKCWWWCFSFVVFLNETLVRA